MSKKAIKLSNIVMNAMFFMSRNHGSFTKWELKKSLENENLVVKDIDTVVKLFSDCLKEENERYSIDLNKVMKTAM